MTHQNDSKKEQDHNITVEVLSGRYAEPKTFTFAQQTKVEELARTAGSEFGYPADQAFYVVRQNDEAVLGDDRTLVSYHIQDGEVLILSARVAGV
ncbi:MAG: hypothetical protein NT018_07540 [Armatimonadetes bacterium]|nr:hypothetical protein [Armatimonadota bacterium]